MKGENQAYLQADMVEFIEEKFGYYPILMYVSFSSLFGLFVQLWYWWRDQI